MPEVGQIEERLGFDFGIQEPFLIKRIVDGRATNFLVESGSNRYLAKLFQSEYSVDRVRLACRFTSHLASEGCPVKEFVQTRTGDQLSVIEDRALVLVPWIDGEPRPERSITSPSDMRRLGEICGDLHESASSFEDGTELNPTLREVPVPVEARWDRFLQKTQAAAESVESVGDQVRLRAHVIETLGDQLAGSESQAHPHIIHGDFYSAHSVWRQGRIVGVIDAVGGRQPFGWELMRCFTQSVPSLWDLPRESVAALWHGYLGGYKQRASASAVQVARGYDAYLLQLTLSSYGLTDSDISDSSLSRFGQWRSRTVDFLASNRDDLLSTVVTVAN